MGCVCYSFLIWWGGEESRIYIDHPFSFVVWVLYLLRLPCDSLGTGFGDPAYQLTVGRVSLPARKGEPPNCLHPIKSL